MQLIPANSRVLCELQYLLVFVEATKFQPLESLCHANAATMYTAMMTTAVGFGANNDMDRLCFLIFLLLLLKLFFVLLARWTDACFQGKGKHL